jgi:hypothetical protein
MEKFDITKIKNWTVEEINSSKYHDYNSTTIQVDNRGKSRRKKIMGGARVNYAHWVWWRCYDYWPEPKPHIHHLDYNSLNDNIENLLLVSRSEHSRIHAAGKTRDEIFGAMNFGSDVMKGKTYEEIFGLEKAEAIKNKISEKTTEAVKDIEPWNKGQPLPDEVKAKISVSRKGKCVGEENGFFGQHHTKKAKRLIGQANTGHVAWNRGMNLAEERPDMVEALIVNHADFSGENNPFYNQHHTKETRKILAEKSTKHQIGDVWQDEKGELKYKNKAGKNRRVPGSLKNVPAYIKEKVKGLNQLDSNGEAKEIK